MKLTVLPSGHGDCLILESGGKTMLIDGGVSKAFREEVMPWLAKNVAKIDCIYVSHIDNDHLGGLIELLDATYKQAVFEFRKGKKPAPKPPKHQPPKLVKIWHNVFSDILEENAEPVAAALSQTAAILSGLQVEDERDQRIREYHDDLAEGAKEAIRISYRVGADQLGLAINPEYKSGLMVFNAKKKQPALTLGKANFTLLAPRAADLEKLRGEWNDWLREQKAVVKDLQKKAQADTDGLTSAAALVEPMRLEARLLADSLASFATKADELGIRRKVTTPNLASLMFLVEEGTQSILLTGDGHADEILTGLAERKKLNADGTLHVDILKIPHHGAEYNTTVEFAERVTAKHYVFCGNGFQGNPEEVVLRTYVEARLKVGGGKYTFWFNNSSTVEEGANATNVKHMQDIEADVATYVNKSNGRMSATFISAPRWKAKQRLELTING